MKQSVTLLRRAQEGEIAVSRSAARRAAHSASGDQLPRMGGALGLELFLSACGWMTCGEVERIAHEGRPPLMYIGMQGPSHDGPGIIGPHPYHGFASWSGIWVSFDRHCRQ